MGLNVDACFFVAREVAQRSMIPNKSGKIINIASIAGLGGPRPDGKIFAVAYNTSKGALITLTEALATEWGKHNISMPFAQAIFRQSSRPDLRIAPGKS
jgi:NAD(P)-dependent dehydrogenase (short-subunit alcohol dehydrogenase family)